MTALSPPRALFKQFFRSAPMPCPYLPGKVERKLFTRLSGAEAAELNSVLTRAGFRRSHDLIYRPICSACSACVPARIPAAKFAPGRTMRKIEKRNADIILREVPPRATAEQYHLFRSYQEWRHSDGDMARMTPADYAAMVRDGSVQSAILECRLPNGTLIGALLIDWLDDGASAVYSFYDPSLEDRSLGTYLIAALTRIVAARGLANVYLGYWIRNCPKMAYKARFKPLEILGAQGWEIFDSVSAHANDEESARDAAE